MTHFEQEPMMTQREASEYISHILRVSYRIVYERYVHLPGFPKAIRPPMSNRKMYNKEEIIEWTSKLRAAA
ncbi:MAG: hypothetical protein PHW66_06225 [Gallionella sp.]|jgi:hypothetical protein|nr:hypothetical protein [Gallionella sp.]